MHPRQTFFYTASQIDGHYWFLVTKESLNSLQYLLSAVSRASISGIISMSTLHKELIIDILSRLPVKSLSRFKCVSKKWQFLISHPLFVKMHLSRTQTLSRTRLVASGMIDLFSIDLETVSGNDDKITMLGLQFPARNPNDTHCIICIGSCNGLLCVINEYSDLFVYNPSTKECKSIAYFGVVSDVAFIHGFGYAKSIDDYKIVRILSSGNIVYVYSLRNDSWRTIKCNLPFPRKYFNLGYCVEYFNAGIALNGAIHWAFESRKGSCVIAAFDLVEEKLKNIPPPDNVNVGKDEWCGYSVGVLRDRLCLVKERRDRDNQIWVMEEYGVKGSWTRIVILLKVSRSKPLCYLNNSETLLLLFKKGLVFYDLKDGKLKKVRIGILSWDDHGTEWYSVMEFGDECNSSDVHVYVESLVSPFYKPVFTIEDSNYEYWFE